MRIDPMQWRSFMAKQSPVGASLLAMDVNDNACYLDKRDVLVRIGPLGC
jgi:hypothetical protein